MAQSETYSQYQLTQEFEFIGRIAAIVKNEGFVAVGTPPRFLAEQIVADVAAQPGISEAYHAAVIVDPPREDAPYADDVITDGALLAAVTAVVALLPAP